MTKVHPQEDMGKQQSRKSNPQPAVKQSATLQQQYPGNPFSDGQQQQRQSSPTPPNHQQSPPPYQQQRQSAPASPLQAASLQATQAQRQSNAPSVKSTQQQQQPQQIVIKGTAVWRFKRSNKKCYYFLVTLVTCLISAFSLYTVVTWMIATTKLFGPETLKQVANYQQRCVTLLPDGRTQLSGQCMQWSRFSNASATCSFDYNGVVYPGNGGSPQCYNQSAQFGFIKCYTLKNATDEAPIQAVIDSIDDSATQQYAQQKYNYSLLPFDGYGWTALGQPPHFAQVAAVTYPNDLERRCTIAILYGGKNSTTPQTFTLAPNKHLVNLQQVYAVVLLISVATLFKEAVKIVILLLSPCVPFFRRRAIFVIGVHSFLLAPLLFISSTHSRMVTELYAGTSQDDLYYRYLTQETKKSVTPPTEMTAKQLAQLKKERIRRKFASIYNSAVDLVVESVPQLAFLSYLINVTNGNYAFASDSTIYKLIATCLSTALTIIVVIRGVLKLRQLNSNSSDTKQ